MRRCGTSRYGTSRPQAKTGRPVRPTPQGRPRLAFFSQLAADRALRPGPIHPFARRASPQRTSDPTLTDRPTSCTHADPVLNPKRANRVRAVLRPALPLLIRLLNMRAAAHPRSSISKATGPTGSICGCDSACRRSIARSGRYAARAPAGGRPPVCFTTHAGSPSGAVPPTAPFGTRSIVKAPATCWSAKAWAASTSSLVDCLSWSSSPTPPGFRPLISLLSSGKHTPRQGERRRRVERRVLIRRKSYRSTRRSDRRFTFSGVYARSLRYTRSAPASWRQAGSSTLTAHSSPREYRSRCHRYCFPSPVPTEPSTPHRPRR